MFRHNTQILTIGKSGSAANLMPQDMRKKLRFPLLIYNSMLRMWVYREGFIDIQVSITLQDKSLGVVCMKQLCGSRNDLLDI